ncbi:MAG: heparan-alpha-glucosaminide N-acetyltransferase domain-containing protein [Vicinamibacterales bacterium]
MSSHRRVVALDVLRGASVAAMVVVNNPGNWQSVYPPLVHAAWNGCTLADLVFPFFVFIMGVGLPFALDRNRVPRVDDSAILGRILKRAATLIVLGLLLNGVIAWPHVASLRIPGVLQRIALTYVIAATAVWYLRPRNQLLLCGALLIVHWVLLGISLDVPHLSASQSLAAWIDQRVFGRHLLRPTGDPEGLLGTISSTGTALMGAAAGHWMRHHRERPRFMLAGLCAGGLCAIVVGLAWARVLPMNKSLWTGSYAVYAAGLAALLFSATHVAVERFRGGVALPLEWLGTNALAIYVGSEFISRLLDVPMIRQSAALVSIKDVVFWQWMVPALRDGGGNRSSLAFGLAYAVAWTAVAGVAHWRGVLIRL